MTRVAIQAVLGGALLFFVLALKAWRLEQRRRTFYRENGEALFGESLVIAIGRTAKEHS